MQLQEKFTNTAVLGAAGKMGSGILLLNAQLVSDLMFQEEFKGKTFTIKAIDMSYEALDKLMIYIRAQMLKYAEKNMMKLRGYYADRADLIENGEIIQAFLDDIMRVIKPSVNLETVYNSHLVFEAVIENLELKKKLFTQITANSDNEVWFLSNTSSIPIDTINKAADLKGNIIGCHFYNPPAVQKLIEVILPEGGNKDLEELVYFMGKQLRKVLVPSNDIAGFIGNGFFMRDLLYATRQYEQLKEQYGSTEALYILNKVSHEFLLRPMGIFQLSDYVGIEVCTFILNVMNQYLEEDLHSEFLVNLVDRKITGGQNSDGSQKDGFFKYEKGRMKTILNPETGNYEDIQEIAAKMDPVIGEMALPLAWKDLARDKQKNEKITDYFCKLQNHDSQGSKWAIDYAKHMREIGLNLVRSGVTDKEEHVNTVMMTGFFHVYGPILNF